jgi:hypothetical protein
VVTTPRQVSNYFGGPRRAASCQGLKTRPIETRLFRCFDTPSEPFPDLHQYHLSIALFAKEYIAKIRSPEQVKRLLNEEDVALTMRHKKAIYIEIADFLLLNGYKLDDLSVFMAVSKGHSALLRLLLIKDGNVNAKSTDGDTAIYDAAGRGFDDIVRISMEDNVYVNMQNSS